ncbi:MAG: hypothetical protein A3F83_02210 [Candidatus Glassbacteria bacterium RIFCSPLOWO2_12_FULL_58_11]|uniref:Uncharacterized protein n=1 Tax=Candidatus Glassbacteria bacterium RIFCSPLOWO2_12_FULL_58_11 TaxID=1817867 RepID=A0A1F5YWS9_9BACT|nr:MAG: hypothetical protein A3F83_02210 [Candidatus Glassbacteria bacterium RIFCSPLOWO2_12_FULL_58_11]
MPSASKFGRIIIISIAGGINYSGRKRACVLRLPDRRGGNRCCGPGRVPEALLPLPIRKIILKI